MQVDSVTVIDGDIALVQAWSTLSRWRGISVSCVTSSITTRLWLVLLTASPRHTSTSTA